MHTLCVLVSHRPFAARHRGGRRRGRRPPLDRLPALPNARSSTDLASSISADLKRGASPDVAAAAAYGSMWTPANRFQRDFQVFGGEFLARSRWRSCAASLTLSSNSKQPNGAASSRGGQDSPATSTTTRGTSGCSLGSAFLSSSREPRPSSD